jgi:hypothetical protein
MRTKAPFTVFTLSPLAIYIALQDLKAIRRASVDGFRGVGESVEAPASAWSVVDHFARIRPCGSPPVDGGPQGLHSCCVSLKS